MGNSAPTVSFWRKLFFHPREGSARTLPGWAKAFNWFGAFVLIAAFFAVTFYRLEQGEWLWGAIWKYRALFITGFEVTVVISLISLVLSTVIGLVMALAGRSRFLLLRYLVKIYVEGVRGTPLLSQILIFFYVFAPAFHVTDRYVVGVLTLSFFAGAYISEIIRAGIEGVPKSQIESARAIGLRTAQTYRFVIFPQAFRQSLPPLAGQFVSLIKDSSLLSFISVNEFTKNAQQVNSITYSTLECYLLLAVGYLCLTLPISLWTRWLENRNKFDT
jgi:polar amino acid transport system permease protein